MPNPTVPAAAPGLPITDSDAGLASWPKAQGELFRARHTEMVKVRAELAQYELQPADGEDTDEKHDEIIHPLEDATRLAMTTFAPEDWMVWQKIAILEHTLHGNGECQWTDNRQVWMLACVKADLMYHGIGGSR